MKKTIYLIACAVLLLSACGEKKEALTASGLKASSFKTEVENTLNELYVLKNTAGMEVCVTNYGARIVSIVVPDKTGAMKDVVLGFDNIDSYLSNRTDFGAAIGRYANRIGKGTFELDRVIHHLRQNDGENTLHGGSSGFQYRMYDIKQIDPQTLECSLLSEDGDNGFPGNLNVKVFYKLTDDNAIDISYEGLTDRTTIVNMTNHSYFNLSGDANNTVLDHVLFMDCDNYTPTDAELIPTGKIETVKATPLDFTTPKTIGQNINDTTFQAIKFGNGFDHNWIFNTPGDISRLGCKVVCPATGIVLEVYTTEPGVQFYTGNFLDGTLTGKNGIVYKQRSGFCLETQHFPDSPNHKNFPSTELRPDGKYTSRCIYKFGVEK